MKGRVFLCLFSLPFFLFSQQNPLIKKNGNNKPSLFKRNILEIGERREWRMSANQ